MLNAAQIDQQLQRAQALAKGGRIGEAWTAIAPLRAAIDNHGGALRLYAFIAQNAGKPDGAIDALRRICVIERDPPELLGALADTLGNASRHDEAYENWSKLVAKDPGAIDAHVHTRDPGYPGEESFETATQSAAAGGVTTIIDMPGTDIPMLADLFGRRDLRITSLWCMGMNQHTRGTAMNSLVHGLHLLSGHFGKPGLPWEQ